MKIVQIFIIVILCFVPCRMNAMSEEAIEEASNMLLTGHLMTIAGIELFQDEAEAEKEQLDTGIQQLQCYKSTLNKIGKRLFQYLGIDLNKNSSEDNDKVTLASIIESNKRISARLDDLSKRMNALDIQYAQWAQYRELSDASDNAEDQCSDSEEGDIFEEEISDGGEESGEIIPLLQSPNIERGRFNRLVLGEKQG